MPSRKLAWDPEHWRFRAEETRTVADQMTHEESRTIMRRIAQDYDRLAKLAEKQLADQKRGTIASCGACARGCQRACRWGSGPSFAAIVSEPAWLTAR